MEIVANLLMALLALALIGTPFLKKKQYLGETKNSNVSEVEKKELLFSALGEIEFDFRMKKLSDEDYQELKADYQREALAVLDQEDKELDHEFEKELLKRKKARGQKPVPGAVDE